MENTEKIIEEIIDYGPIEMAQAINNQKTSLSKEAEKKLLKKIGVISIFIIIGCVIIYLTTRPNKDEAPGNTQSQYQ